MTNEEYQLALDEAVIEASTREQVRFTGAPREWIEAHQSSSGTSSSISVIPSWDAELLPPTKSSLTYRGVEFDTREFTGSEEDALRLVREAAWLAAIHTGWRDDELNPEGVKQPILQ